MIKILFFSVLRELAGCEQLDLSIEGEQHTVGQVLERIFVDYPQMADWNNRLLLAVNGEYSSRDALVGQGDELALMPPVQGG